VRLPGVQEELLCALCDTGKPVVLVLINGRPIALGAAAERCAAILEAWFPGEEGGHAIADVLFGDASPGGKLPISVPGGVGQIPVACGRKPSAFQPYVDVTTAPPTRAAPKALFPFGHGLSYTRFRYSGLRIRPAKAGGVSRVEISCRVANVGKTAGDEVVQLYVRDEVASVSRPVQELKGFCRLTLRPGEARTVTFGLWLEQLAFFDRDMRRVIEPGTHTVMIGASSEDVRLSGTFEVTGPVKVVMSQRRFFSDVAVGPAARMA